MKKRWLALLLALVMAFSLAACTNTDSGDGKDTEAQDTEAPVTEKEDSQEEATTTLEEVVAEDVEGDEFFGKSTDFTAMISNGISGNWFTEYEDAPVLAYNLAKEWDPDGNGNIRKVNIDVWTPPAGSENDYANTLASTGEYPDLMNIQIMNMSAAEMYEDGMILDITDYVMKYMPNYRAFFERHPEYAGRETTYVDGERRYLCVYRLDEQLPGSWGGMLYRRDWIVKYGTNPETGEAFTSEWAEDGNYTDDVVFPSGETYPKTVSDWEWMLEIFAKALESEGIEDGYAYQLGSSGENGAGGDMESGFGAANTWYIDPETNEVVYGGTKDGFRSYLEMMNNWYQKGWVNKDFYERAGEMFFVIDTASVYSGKVGAWYGLTSQLGNSLANPDVPWMKDMCVFAAPTPINDVYGDESVQGIEPFLYYAGGLMGAQWVVSDKAADKDLPALFTFMDHFYDMESGALELTFGLTKEQVEEAKTTAPKAYEIYSKMGLEDGAYWKNDKGEFEKNPVYYPNDVNEIGGACSLVRFLGLTEETRFDRKYLPYYADQMALYRIYDALKAGIGTEITAQLTPDQNNNFSEVYNNVSTYCAQAVPEFITGELDIHDDAAWEEFCETIDSYDVQSYCDDLNGIINE